MKATMKKIPLQTLKILKSKWKSQLDQEVRFYSSETCPIYIRVNKPNYAKYIFIDFAL